MSKSTKQLSGVLNIEKPAGITSHDVVDRIRRIIKKTGLPPYVRRAKVGLPAEARRAKAGHAGTLDPFATGVLVVAIGSATRLLEYVKDLSKTYEATFVLGAVSDTDDVTGEIKKFENKKLTHYACLPGPDPGSTPSAQPLLASPRIQPSPRLRPAGKYGAGSYQGRDDTPPDKGEIEGVLHSFIGSIEQVPPMYSAVKVRGKKLYEYARAGKAVERKPRTVIIHSIELKQFEYPELELIITCGSGTYIRSLARDLGEKLGTGAYVSQLRRTAIGNFTIEQSVKLEDLNVNNIIEHLLPVYTLVEHLPLITLSKRDARNIQRGLPTKLWRPGLQSLDGLQSLEAYPSSAGRGSLVATRPTGLAGLARPGRCQEAGPADSKPPSLPSLLHPAAVSGEDGLREASIALCDQSAQLIGTGIYDAKQSIIIPKKILVRN